MITPGAVKLTPVDADSFEAVGYITAGRKLYIKFRNGPTRCYEGVPGFRHQGLMAAPRKDAYFRSFIKDSFLGTDVASNGL
jgi:hypothetical protein